MQWVINALREHPELALFLTLAIGHGAGRLKLGNFQIGPVLGCLFAGVLVGQLSIPVPEALKNTLFLLFLFAIGYSTGPLFFRGLRSTAGPQIGLTLLLCITALLTAWAVSSLLGFDAGTAGGLVAGAMTSAAALGTASDAVLKLGLDPAQLATVAARQTVAFAVTYLLGMSLVVWLLAHLAPRLLGVDLAAECRQLEREMGVDNRADDLTAYAAVVARAYSIPAGLAGASLADVEALFAGQRVFVERVRHDGRVLEEPSAALRLVTGDRVVLSARLELLSGIGNPLHEHEVDDRELLGIPVATVNMVLTRKELAQRTLAELAQDLGARGVFLRRLTRSGTELPFTPGTRVERGDVLEVFGAKRNLVRIAGQLGYAEWPSNATDLSSVSLAILLGGLLGLPALTLGRVDLGLSLFVGVLLARSRVWLAALALPAVRAHTGPGALGLRFLRPHGLPGTGGH